ncbi:aldo/keto reductase [[Clostridium] hylemonae]|uniref:Oxidoreductase, aldo/keto reductase family protein n=1 Tax=[Clostridium] hylemonae DSM 15053 TaxID=553973 RepID=C0BWT5_9FIRM|nr:aldo/keto reductase [[Clostridium] hylemonae]EEG75533.1 oxidoreductase, aldo/keto reductase family protein [[Clostridium] hylemonae DSM 15053]QEK17895.1 General stress protein 69 [[Clostridium] hylemonae DSM 15053]BDF04926.1 general stress protein 69 [[Clostridium] hylemonae]
MEYFKTAVDGLEITRVGLGTWAMGGSGWGGIVDEPAVECVRAAIDMGITLVDTAPAYGCGHSEELVGEALSKPGYREKCVLATKCGLSWDDNGNVYRDSRPETLRKELEASLRRLKTDHIDIYQVHWPDEKTPIAETAQVMGEFLKEGKIRAIGVSNYTNAMIDEWRKTAPIHTIQPSFNILEDKLFENQLPYAKENNITVLGYSALCRGMLHGKYTVDTKFNEGDMRAEEDPKYQGQNFVNHLAAIDELKQYAAKLGKTVAQISVRWVLEKGVSCALLGARRPDQLDFIPGCVGFSLTKEQCDEMEAIVAKHVPVQVGKDFLAPPLRED